MLVKVKSRANRPTSQNEVDGHQTGVNRKRVPFEGTLFFVTIEIRIFAKRKMFFMENSVLQKGDLIKFHWADEDYVNNIELEVNWEGDLEGIYEGVYEQNDKLANVKVTTKGMYNDRTLHPYLSDLKKIEKTCIIKTEIDGVYIFSPKIFKDDRGYFYESFNEKVFNENTGLDVRFVQDNQSFSKYGTIRGLHFQKPPYAQAKLVRCVQGSVWDVAVDLRAGSPTYGKHVAVCLSEDNHKQLFIPKGFAHGFSVLSETAIFQYKCDEYYHPEAEDGVAYDDPDINVHWGIPQSDRHLSYKDQYRQSFADFKSPFSVR